MNQKPKNYYEFRNPGPVQRRQTKYFTTIATVLALGVLFSKVIYDSIFTPRPNIDPKKLVSELEMKRQKEEK